MELKVTKNNDVTLVEILKNGNPVNAGNPVTVDELETLEIPEGLGGEVGIVSGMPLWANGTVALAIKNLFSAVASVDPRLGGGVIMHSVSPKYKKGQILPLA